MIEGRCIPTEHFYDQLEPPESTPRDHAAEAISLLLAEVVSKRNRGSGSPEMLHKTFEESLRNFIALVFVMRRDLLPDAAQWQVAEALGVSGAALSRLCTKWSDKLGGMRSGGMKSSLARASYQGNYSHPKGTKHATADHIGKRADSKRTLGSMRIIDEAMEYFRNGKPFLKPHRKVLLGWGLIDEHDQFTPRGIAVLNGDDPLPDHR